MFKPFYHTIIKGWVQYFVTLSDNAGFQLNFTNETVVIVESPEYFRNISRFVFNTVYVLFLSKRLYIYGQYSSYI